VFTGVRHAWPAAAPGRADQTAPGGTAHPGPGLGNRTPGARRRQHPVTAFSVWAPAAGQVEVEVAGQRYPMSREDGPNGRGDDNGWWKQTSRT
jgi:hypothetical protein